jgi:hypothetical protein
MNRLIRNAGFASALALGLATAATDGFAQSSSAASARDLNVEAAHPHGGRPPRWRPVRPVQVLRPVQASIVPIGPSVVSIGEPLRFRMASLCEGYGQLYVLSASGRSQLWLENVRMHTGQPLYYPRPGLLVRAAPPAGDETILFVVSRMPIQGFVGGGSSAMPFDLQYTHDGLRAAIQQRLDGMPRSDWALAEISVRVQE